MSSYKHIFIKPLKRKYVFTKKIIPNSVSIFIMYNPHMIKDKDDILSGYLLLLNSDLSIPYIINMNEDIVEYLNKNYKLNFIKDIYKTVLNIDNIKYNTYYIWCNSNNYNTVYDITTTNMIWKDFYFIKNYNGIISRSIIFDMQNYILDNYEILSKIKELLFNK
jgi:hypothetical protein